MRELLLYSLLAAVFSAGDLRPFLVDGRDNVCGPRCVWFLLNWFDRDCELVDVIRETQWPDVEKGTNLAKLKAALEGRGLIAVGIEMQRPALLASHYPGIVHLKADGQTLGHFIVIPPHETDVGDLLTVWDGLSGWRQVDRSSIENRMSPIELFVAPGPVEVQTICQPADSKSGLNGTLFCAGVLMVVIPAALRVDCFLSKLFTKRTKNV